MTRRAKGPGFEERLAELESLVRRIEEGQLPLEESLDLFERGISLSRELQTTLEAAQSRVTRLLEDGREAPLPSPKNAAEDLGS